MFRFGFSKEVHLCMKIHLCSKVGVGAGNRKRIESGLAKGYECYFYTNCLKEMVVNGQI